MKEFIEKLNWRVVLGVTIVALAGIIVFPADTIWNVVFGLPLFACGAYWIFLLWKWGGK